MAGNILSNGKKHAITSDGYENPVGVFPLIMDYAIDTLGLRVKVEKETDVGWCEVEVGSTLWTPDARWRISFFEVNYTLIPQGVFPVGIIW